MTLLSKPIPTDQELEELLAKAKLHKMTPAEIHAQRRSWVIGNIMLSNPEMTREEANAIYDKVEQNV